MSLIIWLLQTLADWRVLAMIFIFIVLYVRILWPKVFDHIYFGISWSKPVVFLCMLGVALLLTREVVLTPFATVQQWLSSSYLWEQVLFWTDRTHIRSILLYAALIIGLWYKFHFLVPALFVGWFGIGLIEITFIIPHYVWYSQLFMGLNWYGPFVAILLPFLLLHKDFSFSRNVILLFGLGMVMQYALLVFAPWGLTACINGDIVLNPYVMPHPVWQSWTFEILNHLMKSLMTIAFLFVNFKAIPPERYDPFIDIGRHHTCRTFLTDAFGLNIGSGKTHFQNKLNIDISKNASHADVIGSAVQLPFTDNSFDEVLFGDAIEHIEAGHDLESLLEATRVLKPQGQLVFSVPSRSQLSMFVDVVWRIKDHRHYSDKQLYKLFSHLNVDIYYMFTSGTIPFIVATLYSHLARCDLRDAYVHCSCSWLGGNNFIIARKRT